MAVIGFSNGSGWVVARWAFRRFLEDIALYCSNDVEIMNEIEQAIALDGLHLDLLNPALLKRLINAINNTAIMTIQEKPDKYMKMKNFDKESYKMYISAIEDLKGYIKKEIEESTTIG